MGGGTRRRCRARPARDCSVAFFLNEPATTEISTLSLHDALPIYAKSFVDPGDVVVVEAPTYLGAIMAFRGYEADVRGVPVDDAGMRVDVLADLLAGGLRPKILYT